jgi:antitoxin ParD1/3/4
MPRARRLQIDLLPDLADNVSVAVKSGEYASPSEVVGEALRGWSARRVAERFDPERLRAAWNEGLASGPSVPGEPVFARIKAKRAVTRGAR